MAISQVFQRIATVIEPVIAPSGTPQAVIWFNKKWTGRLVFLSSVVYLRQVLKWSIYLQQSAYRMCYIFIMSYENFGYHTSLPKFMKTISVARYGLQNVVA